MKRFIQVLIVSVFFVSQVSGQRSELNPGIDYPKYLTIEQSNFPYQKAESSPFSTIEFSDINLISEEKENQSEFKGRKNSVFIEFFIIYPGIGFSRIIQLHSNIGLVVTGSITPLFGWVTDLGGGLIVGKKNHFFEPVAGYWLVADNAYLKLGYRYQASKGFLLRISPAWSFTESSPMWTVSIGYSF